MSRNLVLTLSGLLVTALGTAAVTIVIWQGAPRAQSSALVTIGGHTLQADLAITEAEQHRGLSGTAELADDQGMLFIYPTPRPVSFWMHEMLIPIDIIWINDGQVTGIVKNAPIPIAGQRPAMFASPGPVTAVLEVTAGLSDRLGLTTGSRVTISED